ncbi:metal ABC transporter permease [Aerococcaceae bacterium NML210727]|nr:metal ABC transporter permease [Aerococcaceae bacterium NML210727]MCW6654381.1 metal ABC transporter permease [Aerococcaceae bacterium NML201296]MCW6661145.1 metal ABC transporter permease [Aerococcaceae bacterium NML201209]MCW6662842.1 metal ABC transporter permease [Aerococcaceae bacterium NML190073]MCW6664204.1 metal ABC transporter permease [Aerococcaceae bacterium NML191219]MCW6666276.1 metal ABC transporter permease [Aerococcaceae bacterium NML190938]MCW6674716.1 metal ABC transporte
MEMFQYDFIQRAFIAGAAMSIITPILGLLLILRRQSLMADTLSHVSLAGVAFGVILRLNPTYTTLVIVLVASILIEYLRVAYRDYSEISIALMMSAGMAVALVLMNLNRYATNFKIEQYLFGSIILITPEEVNLLIALATILVIAYLIFRKPLYVMSFDEATAHTSGLPVKWMSIIFSVITGVAVSIMMPIVGALLVSALIVIPAATAIKISKSFTQAIVIGIIINLMGIFMGLTASYQLDTPPGASITICFLLIFIGVSASEWLRTKFLSKK